MAHDPNTLVKAAAASSSELARPFEPLEDVDQRSIADLTDEEAESFGRLAGRNAFLAALEAGVGAAIMENDEVIIVRLGLVRMRAWTDRILCRSSQ